MAYKCRISGLVHFQVDTDGLGVSHIDIFDKFMTARMAAPYIDDHIGVKFKNRLENQFDFVHSRFTINLLN